MPGPAVAGIAGAVVSAKAQSSAAKKAANAQSQAANDQIAESRRQFDLMQSLLRPYVEAGSTSLRGWMDLAGIGGVNGITEIPGTETVSPRFGVGERSFATREEAQAYLNQNPGAMVSARDAQRNAIDALAGGEQFGALVKQGEYGLLANQAATGGLRGGDTARALAEFRPTMLQALIDRQMANLGGMAANGQNAAAMTGNAALQTGQQVNASIGDRGAAQAGAALARGQAFQNATAGILNTVGSMAQPTTQGGGLWQKWRF